MTRPNFESYFTKRLCRFFILLASVLVATSTQLYAASGTKGNAPSLATDRQFMKYDVYAGGFHVVSSDLLIDLHAKTNYLLRLSAFTHGLLGKLAPWHGVFETKGWYNPKSAQAQPEMHSSNTTWRDEREVIEFAYNKDGTFKEHRIYNDKKNGPQPPLPELSKDSTDVLSATLAVMNHISKTGKCEGSEKIFDGARSYNLVYNHKADVILKATDLNVYSGPAVECTVEVKPLKGRWHEKPRGWMSIQEQGRDRGTMPTVWFAQMIPGGPAIPVKIRVKTQYGALMMHLTHYEGPGKNLTIPK